MWTAWTMSQAMKVRPSDLYFIRDEVTAFCFDRAVWVFGTALEADIRESTEGAKDQSQAERKANMRLSVWLRDPEEEQKKAPPKFRDPMDKIKASKATSAAKPPAKHPASKE